MKKIGVILGLILISLVVAACNNTSETDSNSESSANDDENIGETEVTEDENNGQDDGTEESDYTEEYAAGDYLVYGDRYETTEFRFYFTRTAEELTREERFHQSLIESDPSQRDLFSAVTDFEVDGTVVNLYFDENDTLSMASTESAQFWEVLHEIGFRFGIDEFNLFNQDGERGLTFAEGYWEEPVEIEQEPNRGYYVMPTEESERGEYTYISGAVAGEDIYTADGELLDFGQTVEAMATVENAEGSYYSGIYEGLEIEEAVIEGDQAIVKYHIGDGVEASQQEREDFEQVLQLAALDFQVEELKLVNHTDQVISVYPLLNETDGDNTGSESDGEGQEESAELTEDDVPEKVFDYVDEHEDFDTEEVRVMVDREEDGKFIVRVFVFSGDEDDDTQMMNTLGWYMVDKETGEVEEREL
ncbi:hypothetical protein ACS127_05770 [Amphibacillus sp. Q70]|uniref:hypothetical protein n=1 Tax=Amphibacillus sp. Q70 TaxID=3453416 RepID=UPI003F871F07